MNLKMSWRILVVVLIAMVTILLPDHFWEFNIIEVITLGGGLLLLAAGLVGWLHRKWRLRSPCELFFLVPKESTRNVPYVLQDVDREHRLKKLFLPAGDSFIVELILRPRTTFHFQDFYWGFDQGGPEIRRFLNPFVTRGQLKESSPETNPAHYTDHHGHYHIREERTFASQETYVWGFEITTNNVGDFKATFSFVDAGQIGVGELEVTVYDRNTSEQIQMSCVKHENCVLRPAMKLTPDIPAQGTVEV